MDEAASKTKRSTIACTFCRDRKIKCTNNNDGQPCKRCAGAAKECEYKPVSSTTPNTESPDPILSIPPAAAAGFAWGRADPSIDRSPITSDGPPFSFQGQPTSVSYPPTQDYQRPPPNPAPNPIHQHQLHLPYAVWPNPPQHPYVQGFPPFGNSSNPNHDHIDNSGGPTDDGGR